MSPLSPFAPAAPCKESSVMTSQLSSAGPVITVTATRGKVGKPSISYLNKTAGHQQSSNLGSVLLDAAHDVCRRLRELYSTSTFVSLYWQLGDSSVLSPIIIMHIFCGLKADRWDWSGSKHTFCGDDSIII